MPQPPKGVEVSKEEIGQRIRVLRHRLGLSQGKLAKILGTHHSAVSHIERGTRSVTIHQVIKLARALRVSTDEILLNGSGTKKETSLGTGRLLRRLELVTKLPPSDQRALLGHLSALLKSRGIRARPFGD